MRRPGKDEDSENVPPGGRAFQRIQQDRTARGLDKLAVPGTSDAVTNKRAANKLTDRRRKKK